MALSVPVPLPSSTARQSNMPKAWKYLCYKDSWAECAWCMSLCFSHTVQQQQALNISSVNMRGIWFCTQAGCKPPGNNRTSTITDPLCSEGLHSFSEVLWRFKDKEVFSIYNQKLEGGKQAVLGALDESKELTCTTGCMTAPSCLCLPLQHFSPLFHQSNRHGFNFP